MKHDLFLSVGVEPTKTIGSKNDGDIFSLEIKSECSARYGMLRWMLFTLKTSLSLKTEKGGIFLYNYFHFFSF